MFRKCKKARRAWSLQAMLWRTRKVLHTHALQARRIIWHFCELSRVNFHMSINPAIGCEVWVWATLTVGRGERKVQLRGCSPPTHMESSPAKAGSGATVRSSSSQDWVSASLAKQLVWGTWLQQITTSHQDCLCADQRSCIRNLDFCFKLLPVEVSCGAVRF